MTITKSSRKDEIWAAYVALQEQPTTWTDVWDLSIRTAHTVVRETRLLVADLQKAGIVAKQWFSLLVDTYRQPLLRSKANHWGASHD